MIVVLLSPLCCPMPQHTLAVLIRSRHATLRTRFLLPLCLQYVQHVRTILLPSNNISSSTSWTAFFDDTI